MFNKNHHSGPLVLIAACNGAAEEDGRRNAEKQRTMGGGYDGTADIARRRVRKSARNAAGR